MSFDKEILDILRVQERHELRLDHLEKAGEWIMKIIAVVVGGVVLALTLQLLELRSERHEAPSASGETQR